MIHLPKKRPWILLLIIYGIIILVWGVVYYLAKENGELGVDPGQAKELLEQQKKQNKAKNDAQ